MNKELINRLVATGDPVAIEAAIELANLYGKIDATTPTQSTNNYVSDNIKAILVDQATGLPILPT